GDPGAAGRGTGHRRRAATMADRGAASLRRAHAGGGGGARAGPRPGVWRARRPPHPPPPARAAGPPPRAAPTPPPPARAPPPRTGPLAMLRARGGGAVTAALITPVMLATGLATSLLYMQTAQQAAADRAYARHLRAGLVITSRAGGIPLAAAARARRLPGAAAASPLVTSTGFFNVPPGADSGTVDSIPLEGLDGASAGRVAEYRVTAGLLAHPGRRSP